MANLHGQEPSKVLAIMFAIALLSVFIGGPILVLIKFGVM